jgi:hypothetical protein
MEHFHYLHSQRYHDTTTRFAKGGCHAKLQLFAAIDHVLQHVIDRVLMHACTISNDLSHLSAHLAKETRGAGFVSMSWIVGEDAT